MKHVLTAKRAQEILQAFGAQPANWPKAERSLLMDYLAQAGSNDPIHALMAQESSLDSYIAQDAPANEIGSHELYQMQQSVLGKVSQSDQLKEPVSNRLAEFVLSFLKPGWNTAMAMSLAVAIAVGLYFYAGGESANNQTSFETWAWQDMTGDPSSADLIAANNSKSSNSTLSAIAMFEPDLEADDF